MEPRRLICYCTNLAFSINMAWRCIFPPCLGRSTAELFPFPCFPLCFLLQYGKKKVNNNNNNTHDHPPVNASDTEIPTPARPVPVYLSTLGEYFRCSRSPHPLFPHPHYISHTRVDCNDDNGCNLHYYPLLDSKLCSHPFI